MEELKGGPPPPRNGNGVGKLFRKLGCLLGLIAADVAALLAAVCAAYLLRSQLLTRLIRFDQSPLSLQSQISSIFPLGALIIVVMFAFNKLYTRRLTFWQEARGLFKSTALTFILIMTVVFVSRRYTEFSRIVVILTGLLSLALFPVFRLLMKKFLGWIHLWKKRVIILGTGETAELAARGIQKNPVLGYEIAGFLSDRQEDIGRVLVDDIKVIGRINQIAALMPKHNIQDIIVAMPEISTSRLVKLIERSEEYAETIRFIPGLGSLFTMGVEVEDLGDVLGLSVARNLTKPWNIATKRIMEFILALVSFIVLFPLFMVIAVAIRLDSPGPVIFSQERLGMRNRVFRLFKFRSMHIDSDSKLQDHLERNPEVKEEWHRYQKIKNGDPRVTRVGRIVRKYSLDEIPQLLNILRGQMSLVGPRPYLPREIDEIGDSYHIISQVKPGITGLWQVSGRNDLPFKERLFLDEFYIRNWSIWLDVVILFKTIKVLIRQEGAF
jgi:Undecaprenyl-phosphate galactose phosphotransferase WbaP